MAGKSKYIVYKCDLCGVEFPTKEGIYAHLKSVHMDWIFKKFLDWTKVNIAHPDPYSYPL